jgi:hypothetical protein
MRITVLTCVAALAIAGCGGEPKLPPASPAFQPKRIVLVTIDTWRADALGASGSGKVNTPVLDAFARTGWYCPKAWSSATLTAPSHATILTGLQPYHHGVRDNHGFRLSASIPTLASLLPVSTTNSRALAATSPEIVQQLFPLTFGINVMRRSVDQLAAKQEQLAQNIAVLQAAIEEDVRQKVSPAPPTPAQQDASKQQPKLSQPKARSGVLHSSSVPRQPSRTGFVSR